MECQDCCSSARFQCTRKFLHKFIENLIFMVDIYSQCLKDALAGFLNRVFALLLRYKRKCIFYYFTKFKKSYLFCDPYGFHPLLPLQFRHSRGSSEFSYNIPASSSREILSSRSAALMPHCWFSLRSNGPSVLNVKPRCGLSICIDDTQGQPG